jgi:hypothetical protein
MQSVIVQNNHPSTLTRQLNLSSELILNINRGYMTMWSRISMMKNVLCDSIWYQRRIDTRYSGFWSLVHNLSTPCSTVLTNL